MSPSVPETPKRPNVQQLNMLAAIIREGGLTNLSTLMRLYWEQAPESEFKPEQLQELADHELVTEYVGVKDERNRPDGRTVAISSTTDEIYGITDLGRARFREGRSALKESHAPGTSDPAIDFLLSEDAARLEQQQSLYHAMSARDAAMSPRSFFLNARKSAQGTFAIPTEYLGYSDKPVGNRADTLSADSSSSLDGHMTTSEKYLQLLQRLWR